MAQKIHPVSLRLNKTNKLWSSCWYGDYNYTSQLKQDCGLHAYIENICQQAKMAPPVLFITRAQQEMRTLLFFPRKQRMPRFRRKGASFFSTIRPFWDQVVPSGIGNAAEKRAEANHTYDQQHNSNTPSIAFHEQLLSQESTIQRANGGENRVRTPSGERKKLQLVSGDWFYKCTFAPVMSSKLEKVKKKEKLSSAQQGETPRAEGEAPGLQSNQGTGSSVLPGRAQPASKCNQEHKHKSIFPYLLVSLCTGKESFMHRHVVQQSVWATPFPRQPAECGTGEKTGSIYSDVLATLSALLASANCESLFREERTNVHFVSIKGQHRVNPLLGEWLIDKMRQIPQPIFPVTLSSPLLQSKIALFQEKAGDELVSPGKNKFPDSFAEKHAVDGKCKSKWNIINGETHRVNETTALKSHLENSLFQQCKEKCKVHYLVCPSAQQNPLFLATQIIFSLEERIPFRRLKHRLMRECSKDRGIKGIRISCSGRVATRSKKAQKARTESIQWGQTSLNVFSDFVHFASKSALTPFGKIGVKVWICYR